MLEPARTLANALCAPGRNEPRRARFARAGTGIAAIVALFVALQAPSLAFGFEKQVQKTASALNASAVVKERAVSLELSQPPRRTAPADLPPLAEEEPFDPLPSVDGVLPATPPLNPAERGAPLEPYREPHPLYPHAHPNDPNLGWPGAVDDRFGEIPPGDWCEQMCPDCLIGPLRWLRQPTFGPGGPPQPWYYLRYTHGEINHPGRHVGKGGPLVGTSWLNRPVHWGVFAGALMTQPLIPGRVNQNDSSIGGYRFGLDMDHYWGVEMRLAFSQPDIFDDVRNSYARSSNIGMYDIHVLYYPWGDSRWRPYFSLGTGVANFRFYDDNRLRVSDTLWQLPAGFGMKYQMRRWLALRLEVCDNIAFGHRDLATMHNVSVTAGLEVHTGGVRKNYYPWHTGIFGNY